MSDIHNAEVYLGCPRRGRLGEDLAHGYGYGTNLYNALEGLADSLVEGASVVDVGAGFSSLGERLCQMRPDITCVNVDYAYHSREARERVLSSAPSNLSAVAANVLDLPDSLGRQNFDNVFSWWLLPHIYLAGRAEGLKATNNILDLAVPEKGRVALGPKRSRLGTRIFSSAVHFNGARDEQERQIQAEVTFYELEMTWLGKTLMRHFNLKESKRRSA